jgi:hypothetical protein
MTDSASAILTPKDAQVSTDLAPRLRGRWLLLARLVWLAISALALGFFAVSIPTYLLLLQTLCNTSFCAYGQITPETAQALGGVGVSLDDYAIANLVATITSSFVWFAVAGVLFWRRSHDWMALLAALFLVLNGTLSVIETLGTSHLPRQVPVQCLGGLFFLLFGLVASLFPDGRFVPSWIKWPVLAFSVLIILSDVFFTNPFLLPTWLSAAIALLLFGFYVCLALAQIYRFRFVSSPLQRQQTKWIVLGTILAIVVIVGGELPTLLFPTSLYLVVYRLLLNGVLLLIPISFAVAFLRYRLWDVDVLINQALVYGGLSGILGAIYASLIIGLESLASAVTDQTEQHPVVLVISTLAIAALFLPVRRRLQAIIDRRFYRRKYDAEKTLATFSAALRQQVDMEQLREQFLAVVQETMEPTSVSLWLRQPVRPSADPVFHLKPHYQVPTTSNLD